LESESGGFVDLESGRISAENVLEGPPRSSGPEEGQGISSLQPLTSPLTEGSPTAGNASAISEKARGKMKERRSLSLDTTSSLDRIAAAGVGRNGFVPTQEWVCSLSILVSSFLADNSLAKVTSWQQG
jgi:hypothetical protein